MNTSECKEILKALSDDTRMKIFEILRGGKLCGCKILERLHITQPTLSHHMKVLCACGIVTAEKEWKWNHYSINCEKLHEWTAYLGNVQCRKDNGR